MILRMSQINQTGIKGIKGLYNNGFKIFLFLAILMPPAIFNKYENIDATINILRIIVAFVIMVDYFIQGKISRFLCIEAGIWIVYLIYCILNNSYEYHVLVDVATIISLTAMIESCFLRENEQNFYKGLRIILFIYLLANTASIFINGLEKLRSAGSLYYETKTNLFLGFDNDIAMEMIPLIGVLLSDEHGNKIDLLIVSLALANFLLTNSGSGILVFALLFIYYFIRKHCTLPKWVKSWTILLFFGVMFILVYAFQIQRFFSFLIINILGKDLGLTNRMHIWSYILNAVKEQWLFGYGNYSNNSLFLSRIPEYWTPAPHNIFLYLLLMGGIIGLILFIYMVMYSFKRIDKGSRHDNKNSTLLITLFCYFMCGMVASYYSLVEFSVLLAVAYQVGQKISLYRTSVMRNEKLVVKNQMF